MPTVLPYLSNPWIADTPLLCIMDSFHSPNCMPIIFNDPDLADTCRPFQQDCPPLLLGLTTWHYITAITCSTGLCLAFPASVQQGKALKMQPRCAQQPNYAYHTYQKYTGSPWVRNTSLQGTKCWFPMVSAIDGFHCIFFIYYSAIFTNASVNEGHQKRLHITAHHFLCVSLKCSCNIPSLKVPDLNDCITTSTDHPPPSTNTAVHHWMNKMQDRFGSEGV